MSTTARPASHVPDGRLEYVRLDDLMGMPGNPKRHDVPALKESMERFGFVGSLVVNEATGYILEGHGRVKALIELRDEGKEPPLRIGWAEDGEWLAPVQRGNQLTESDARVYAATGNRLVVLGGFDDRQLLMVLQEQQEKGTLHGTTYTDDDIDALMRSVHGSPPAGFAEFGEDADCEYKCPMCEYEWNGNPR